MNHALIDCETLGLTPDAVVLSIGVCIWDPYKEQSFEELLHQTVLYGLDIRHQLVDGRAVCPDTQRWWGEQSEEAREATFHGTYEVGYVLDVLRFLNVSRYWSRGSMDMQWLKSLGWEPKYNKQRDVRTILADYMEQLDFPERFIHHRADHDAAWDAYCLQRFHRTTRFGEG